MNYYDSHKEFSDLVGKTLVKITGLLEGSDEVVFECSDGFAYKLYHEQDCCESVSLADVCGDTTALIGSPITLAEERSGENAPPQGNLDYVESYTWTFYTIATVKGYVDMRWYGESNGHYSEGVDFVIIQEATP